MLRIREQVNENCNAARRMQIEYVHLDADEAWNADAQRWELATVCDNATCEMCGGETSIEEFKIGGDRSKAMPRQRLENR